MSRLTVSSLLRSRLLWACVVGLASLAGLMIWRAYPWQLALMSGAAIGGLVFFTLDAAGRLHREYFGPRR